MRGRPILKIATLLLPTDFSAAAEPAYGWAADLAAKFGARLVVLHVFDPTAAAPASIDIATFSAAETMDALEREAEGALSRLAVRLGGADTLLRPGSPAATIVSVASELGASLIVMGTRGGGAASGGGLFGRIADDVVRNERTPVLTVPPEPAAG